MTRTVRHILFGIILITCNMQFPEALLTKITPSELTEVPEMEHAEMSWSNRETEDRVRSFD